MKLMYVIGLILFIVFLNIGLYLPSLFHVDEDDIRKNLMKLKNLQWFQNITKDQRYKQLIVHDADVRKCIGRFNTRKIDRKSFQKKYELKLKSILHEKTKKLA